MLRRAGAGFVHNAGESGAAPAGNDDPVSPGAFRAAEDRTEISGVADPVAGHQKGRLPPGFRRGKKVLRGTVFPHRCHRDHALMRAGGAEGVQLPAVGFHHRNAAVPGPGGNVAQGPVSLAAGHIDLVQTPSGPQRLDDRVAPFDQVFSVLFKCHVPLRV